MDNKVTDQELFLIKKAIKGDSKAFADLYAEIYKDLYRFALFHLRHKQDGEDAVSNGCIKAFQNIKNLKKADSFRSWMFQIVLNEARQIIRKRKDVPVDTIPDNASYYDRDVALSHDLKNALDNLEDEEREIVLLSSIGGYNSEEIGKIKNIPSGTVRSKLSRSYEKLRNLL